MVFIDTEGFESTGKPDAYDDRIFALSAILGSVLVYNLPETVKEADIEKLSFAAELADEFFGRVNGPGVALAPAQLLWLIQRDFLEGKTVSQMVKEVRGGGLDSLSFLPGGQNCGSDMRTFGSLLLGLTSRVLWDAIRCG
jgi:hypothetical protein